MSISYKKYPHFNPLNVKLNPICHLLALLGAHHILHVSRIRVNPSNAKLNTICHLLALLGAHHILHFSRIRVNPSNAKLNTICHLLTLLGAHHILHVSRIRVNYWFLFTRIFTILLVPLWRKLNKSPLIVCKFNLESESSFTSEYIEYNATRRWHNSESVIQIIGLNLWAVPRNSLTFLI